MKTVEDRFLDLVEESAAKFGLEASLARMVRSVGGGDQCTMKIHLFEVGKMRCVSTVNATIHENSIMFSAEVFPDDAASTALLVDQPRVEFRLLADDVMRPLIDALKEAGYSPPCPTGQHRNGRSARL
jgi:hypothetical protein